MRAVGIAAAALAFANADSEYDKEVAATAELDEDPYHACMEEYGCYKIEDHEEHEMCAEQCHQIEENVEEDDVWGCLMEFCGDEINTCIGNDMCAMEASEEHARMACVENHFEGCTPEFQFAFQCYMGNCFHESHIPYIHSEEGVTADDLHHIANNGHHDRDEYDRNVAATAEMDDDPYHACMEEYGCYHFEDHHEQEMCAEKCHQVEDNAEEDDVWGCLMDNCEEQINNCMSNDMCMGEASDEHTRMTCVTDRFEGCSAEFQYAFACYMDHCFHESHIPYLHHDEGVSVEDLHDIAHNGHHSDHYSEEWHSEDKHEEHLHSGEYFDEEEAEIYHEEEQWESEEKHHDKEENHYHEEHEEHHAHRCPHFDETQGSCDPHQCYDNGHCEAKCPEGFTDHDGFCINEHCGEGMHVVMDWEQHPAKPYCADVRPSEIDQKIPFNHGEECWHHGEGWEHRWLPDENEHWNEYCVKFSECGPEETRVWGIHGKQYCSANHVPEHCEGVWSDIWNKETHHHSRVCVEGARADCGPDGHVIVDWGSEGEPSTFCINASPVEIEEYEPVLLTYEDRGDNPKDGCQKAPEDGSCNQHTWYCNGHCDYVECWQKGEGWQDLWEHGRQACVKYSDCGPHEARVHNLRGTQLCTGDHHVPHCSGAWSWMYSEKRGHHIRVCVEGHEAEVTERGTHFHSHHDHHHHGSEEHDVWGCLKENCPTELDNCITHDVCGHAAQDDHAREFCMENGFPEKECSMHLLPLFECYMQSCE